MSKFFAKKFLITYIVISAAFIVSLVGFLIYSIVNDKANLYSAEVSLVSGNVEKSSTTGSWVELKNSESIKQGDLVRINGVGKAVITLDDGSAIRLSDNSRIKLASLDPKNIQIINEKGEIYTRVVKADRPFIVKVDDESYKAMGTAYKTVNLDKEKGVFVYESKVQAVVQNIEIAAGKKYYKNNTVNGSLAGKVTDISTDEVSKDTFVQWNKEQDLKSDEFKKYMGVLETKTTTKETTAVTVKTETPAVTVAEPKETAPTPEPVAAKITLTASANASGVELHWTASGISTANGFKIVKSTSENPVYPGDSYIYLSSSTSNNYSWNITDGVTYYFRVCQYTGDGCGTYSNNVKVKAPHVEEGTVTSLVLSGTGKNVNWTVAGYSDLGFKVVWSKTAAPTYPTRATDTYHYLSSPATRSDELTTFDGAGTYHVRVCEYLGGSCGVYSNEITVTLAV